MNNTNLEIATTELERLSHELEEILNGIRDNRLCQWARDAHTANCFNCIIFDRKKGLCASLVMRNLKNRLDNIVNKTGR